MTHGMKKSRSMSDAEVTEMQASTNQNVAWLNNKSVWLAYLIAIVIFRAACFAYCPKSLVSAETEWTLTAVVHAIISFIGLHWNRGSPFWEDQGAHIEETVWEQIDNGVPWTRTRKYFMLVPVVLFMVSAHFTNYDVTHLVINLVVLAILIAAKLPELHGIRIFGINSGKMD